jgi:hypothetical protein
MKLKKFEDFLLELKESVNLANLDEFVDISYYDKNLINEEEKNFLYKFNSVIKELDISSSFKKMCQNTGSGVSFSESDKDILEALKSNGLTFDEVEKHKNLIFDNIDKYDSINGIVDILLYKLNPEYKLGQTDTDWENEPEEIIIKYSYGYHLTDWGRIFLKQNYGGVDEFLTSIKDEILLIFLETSLSIEEKKAAIDEIREEFNFTDVEEDRVRVYFSAFFDVVSPLIDWRSYNLVKFNPYLMDKGEDYRYDSLKSFFKLWVYENLRIDVDDVEDEDEYIDIYM